MKRTKIKILITLVVGVVVLFLIFFMVFNKPESVPNGSRTHIQWLYHRIYQLHVVYCVVQLAMLLAEIVHSISNFLCIFFHCRAKNMLVNLFNHSCT